MLNPKALGRRLASLRRQTGFTLEQVAGYLGQSQQTMRNLESGQCPLDLLTLHRLEDLYGVAVSDLLDSKSLTITTSDRVRNVARLSSPDLVVLGQLRRFARNLDDLNQLVSVP